MRIARLPWFGAEAEERRRRGIASLGVEVHGQICCVPCIFLIDVKRCRWRKGGKQGEWRQVSGRLVVVVLRGEKIDFFFGVKGGKDEANPHMDVGL